VIPWWGAAATSCGFDVFAEKSHPRALLDHSSTVADPREAWRVAHPLPDVLLPVVCGTMAECADYDAIAAWGEKRLSVCAAICAIITVFAAVAR
jgi:DDE_Tnp_1-associated